MTESDSPESRISTETPKNLLEAFEQIVEAVEDSRLSDEFFILNSAALEYVKDRLGFTPMQAVMMALLVDKSEERDISPSKVAQYIGCRTTRILRLRDELDELEKRRYIRIVNTKSVPSFRIPGDVVRALSADRPYEYHREPLSDLLSFFGGFRKLVAEKDEGVLNYSSLKAQTLDMLEEIPSSSLAKGMRRLRLDEDKVMLLLFMAYLYVEDDNDDVRTYELERLYDDDEVPLWVRHETRGRNSELKRLKLIENSFEDGMTRSDSCRLTEKAKMELFADMEINTRKGTDAKGLTKYEDLAPRKLFFNETEKRQIDELTKILSPRRFAKVQSRMRKAGMRAGFCCLFYGSPGTGKTESVYQIARATRRNIKQVDVDKIKSCWVGESEKNIKSLFDRYRLLCNDSTQTPILLFNEADAVFGVRMEGASKAVDKMENSLQNIILQEMEKLDGILIATTNLTGNLDKAFERRFLYKIRYDRPGKETRAKIWRNMVPGLRHADAMRLAAAFDLSGGEIENIARKHTVGAILYGEEGMDTSRLAELCRTERLSDSAATRIGFGSYQSEGNSPE